MNPYGDVWFWLFVVVSACAVAEMILLLLYDNLTRRGLDIVEGGQRVR